MSEIDEPTNKIAGKNEISSIDQETLVVFHENNHPNCMESCVAINTIYEGIIRLDTKKRIIFTNERLLKLLGFSAKELKGKQLKWIFADTKDKQKHKPVGNVLDSKKAKKGVTLETSLKSKEGQPVSVIFSINSVINTNGRKEYLAIVTDIRRLQQAHENTKNLLHSEKINVLGHLSASIAHEINNPLSYLILDMDRQDGLLKSDIHPLIEQINDRLTETEKKKIQGILTELEELSESTKSGLKRIADIVSAVKGYSRLEDTPTREEIALEDMLETTLKLVESKTKNRISIVKKFDPDLPRINIAGGRLAQVALNIIVNSIQAIENKGTITIKTFKNYSPRGVGFEISDNGQGMSKTILQNIFNPYFTTKKDGTGLGLAIAKNIVDELKGIITCKSEEGKGTSTRVFIPF